MEQEQHELRLHKLPEAQSRLGVGRSTLYALMSSGQIETVHIGRRVLIPSDAIDAFISRSRAGSPSTSEQQTPTGAGGEHNDAA